MEGSVETAKQGNNVGLIAVERKVDQVVDELKRYQVKVAALQEAEWFGEKVYKVRESIVLTSDRPLLDTDRSRQRGEGAAIVLCEQAINARRNDGSQWKAWNSSFISASLDPTYCAIVGTR